jgi:hypothetical protein
MFLTPQVGFWSTLINVMRTFSTSVIVITGIAGAARIAEAISIPVIRISCHNVRAGIGA